MVFESAEPSTVQSLKEVESSDLQERRQATPSSTAPRKRDRNTACRSISSQILNYPFRQGNQRLSLI